MKHTYNPTRGFIAGLVALLLLASLAGCSDLVKPDLVNPEAGTSAGTGRLTIALTGTGTGTERTLFPSAPESFSKYELAFTPKSGQKDMDPVMFTEGTSHSLTLPVGDWTVTALAYIRIQDIEGITDGDYVAARGSKDLTVSASDMYETIDLRGGVDGEGKGVFSYDITLPNGLGSASLEILGLGGNSVKWVDLKLAASGSFALDSGYYLLKISRAGGGDAEVRAEVVHIYTALTTEAAGPGYDFTGFGSIADVRVFLSSRPANTAGSPYTVALRGLDMETDLEKGGDPLGLLFEVLDGKYVNLDLSACGGNISNNTVNNRPNRDKIVSLTLPDSFTSIGQQAFYGCTSLVAISLPNILTTIGWSAFSGCTSLAAIDLPDSLTSIEGYAFFGCMSLAAIDLPESLTSIGPQAFSGCTSLASIDLPDSLTSIKWSAFEGCTSLAYISLPNTLTTIGDYTFQNFTSLVSISLPNILTTIGWSAFSGCTSLAAIDLPDSLTSIGLQAFRGCTSLVAIDLSDSLTSIGVSAFYNCTSLAAIDLPDSLTSIREYAFDNCSSLEVVISRNTTPPELGYSTFYNTSSALSIYVPDTSVAAYKSAWSSYSGRIKPLSQLPGA
jgi:hypothetical protein